MQTHGDVTAAPDSDDYRRKEAKPDVTTQPKGPPVNTFTLLNIGVSIAADNLMRPPIVFDIHTYIQTLSSEQHLTENSHKFGNSE